MKVGFIADVRVCVLDISADAFLFEMLADVFLVVLLIKFIFSYQLHVKFTGTPRTSIAGPALETSRAPRL
jgi:hypothetical protein